MRRSHCFTVGGNPFLPAAPPSSMPAAASPCSAWLRPSRVSAGCGAEGALAAAPCRHLPPPAARRCVAAPHAHLPSLLAVTTKVQRNKNMGKLQAGYLFPEASGGGQHERPICRLLGPRELSTAAAARPSHPHSP